MYFAYVITITYLRKLYKFAFYEFYDFYWTIEF